MQCFHDCLEVRLHRLEKRFWRWTVTQLSTPLSQEDTSRTKTLPEMRQVRLMPAFKTTTRPSTLSLSSIQTNKAGQRLPVSTQSDTMEKTQSSTLQSTNPLMMEVISTKLQRYGTSQTGAHRQSSSSQLLAQRTTGTST